jgi:anti-sigma B factor antagonist
MRPLQNVDMLIRTWSLDDRIALLELTGRLTAEAGSALSDAVSRALSEGRRQIVLNLIGVGAVDASGLGMLASALSCARAATGEVKLVTRSATLHELLARTHLLLMVNTCSTEAEAIAAFEGATALVSLRS